jgi:hypothetical protein
MNDEEQREGRLKESQDLPSLESGEGDALPRVLAEKEDEEGTVSQSDEFQGSALPNSGAVKPDQPVPHEVQAESEA